MTKHCLTLLLLLASALSACSSDDDENLSDYGGNVSKTYLTISPLNINIGADGESKEITVNSNASWTVSVSKGWISVDKNSGTGSSTVRITVSANNSGNRQATLSFTGSGITRVCAVTQETSNTGISSDDTTPTNVVAVDLGLPSGTKWANMNVGATLPEDYGEYYAWGETETKKSYNSDNSATSGLGLSELLLNGITGLDGNLAAKYDAATMKWGSEWHIPTEKQVSELLSKCTWTWATQNGVQGYIVTGLNGNSIFLAAAGCYGGETLFNANKSGYYWSATYHTNGSSLAYDLYFHSESTGLYYGNRNEGHTIRAVSEQ